MPNFLYGVLLLLAPIPVAAQESGSPQSLPPEFAQDIQPLLEDHCYDCHGPDSREGGLRLSNRREAFLRSDSGVSPIQPENAEQSLLFQRITSAEAALRMPPPDSGSSLSPREILKIRDWINAGADWPEESSEPQASHWAYRSPVRPEVPPVIYDQLSGSPIDRFVARKLKQAGLAPAPPEGRARLLRRVSLVLTGLPPSVTEVDAFLADQSPDAYERAVDRLLASPHYGEHWGAKWLDLARYADSNGFQADQLRESWPYRDWVIQSVNADQPFDQFTIEQLAGDLLPNATPEQKTATGFHRTVMCNVEAGVDPEENRVNQVIDRVNTTGTVFLGTTIECCQCHNHKYDPFSQEEFYSLFAYFNNTPLEVKQAAGVRYDFIGPSMELPLSAEQQAVITRLRRQQAALKQQRSEIKAGLKDRLATWEAQLTLASREQPLWSVLPVESVKTTGGEATVLREDGSILVSGPVPDKSDYLLQTTVPAAGLTAVKLEVLREPSLPGGGPGRGDPKRRNFILSEFEAKITTADGAEAVTLIPAATSFSQKGWDVARSVDGDPATGWAVSPKFSQNHFAVYVIEAPVQQPGARLQIRLRQHYGQGRTIGCFRIHGTAASSDTLSLPENVLRILQVSASQRTPKDQRTLEDYYLSESPEVRQLDRQLQAIEKEIDTVKPPTTLVMQELPEPRTTHILVRGDYLNPGDTVLPGTPSVLHSMSDETPKNRLGLARWIASSDNPLTARVTVNRWWGQIFGRSLVVTPEDFGTQADLPTHPQLLDWLAVEFQQSGWSRKHMLRLMVLSETFRQSQEQTAEKRDIDPDNRLLSRGPRFRLSAESVRDNALAAAGLLDATLGGPPVMPYQPDGLWNTVGRNAPVWKAAEDGNRYRRGVYVVWRRAAPYPSFVNFDAPDRSTCTVDRSRTNTPLQALTLLNDQAYLEAGLGLARRMQNHATDDIRRAIAYGFRCCVARYPETREIDTLEQLFTQQLEAFQSDPEAARRLIESIHQPNRPVAPGTPELATWTVVAGVLLNLDETITP